MVYSRKPPKLIFFFKIVDLPFSEGRQITIFVNLFDNFTKIERVTAHIQGKLAHLKVCDQEEEITVILNTSCALKIVTWLKLQRTTDLLPKIKALYS